MVDLKPRAAAEIASVHVETLTKALRAGELKGFQRKKNATWRIPEENLRAWMRGEEQVAA
jgi:predicted site-specific integrase-resolvase